MSCSYLIDAQDLQKKYGKTVIFNDLSFGIGVGETVGLFGESGCGKTTMGRILVRMEKPNSGRVLFKGEDIIDMKQKEFKKVRTKIQMVFQNPETSLDPRIRLFDCIAEPLRVHERFSANREKAKVMEMIDMVGLRDIHLCRYPHQLSGGEIQRAVLARVFSLEPDFIVADEPTSMLDVSTQAQILRLMMDLQEKKNVSYLLISHDMDVLKAVCDRILKLEGGALSEIRQ